MSSRIAADQKKDGHLPTSAHKTIDTNPLVVNLQEKTVRLAGRITQTIAGIKESESNCEPQSKRCSRCKKNKTLDCFARNSAQQRGTDNQCKECVSARRTAAYKTKKFAARKKRSRSPHVLHIDDFVISIKYPAIKESELNQIYGSLIDALLEASRYEAAG